MQTKKGFTLIELLVVVAIIGLLATLGVIAFRDAQRKARDSKRVADISAVVQALAAANQEGRVFCTSACAAIAADTLLTGVAICNDVDGNRACSVGDTVDSTFINFATLKDPLPAYATDATCGFASHIPAQTCGYVVETGSTIGNYYIGFTTEQDNVTGLVAGTAHAANSNGIFN